MKTISIKRFISAGCVKKTLDKCNKSEELVSFSNEKGDKYFSKAICKYCYNMVFTDNDDKYHYVIKEILGREQILRINFTLENEGVINEILKKVTQMLNNNKE